MYKIVFKTNCDFSLTFTSSHSASPDRTSPMTLTLIWKAFTPFVQWCISSLAGRNNTYTVWPLSAAQCVGMCWVSKRRTCLEAWASVHLSIWSMHTPPVASPAAAASLWRLNRELKCSYCWSRSLFKSPLHFAVIHHRPAIQPLLRLHLSSCDKSLSPTQSFHYFFPSLDCHCKVKATKSRT